MRLTKTKRRVKVGIALIWIYSLIFPSLFARGVTITLFLFLYCHLHVTIPIIVLYGILENIPCPSLAHNYQVQDVADDEGRQQMEQGTQNDILILVILVLFYGS